MSPWHDIPLWAEEGKLLNFICEIPKETSAKMEVGTSAHLSVMPAANRTSAKDEVRCFSSALCHASLVDHPTV